MMIQIGLKSDAAASSQYRRRPQVLEEIGRPDHPPRLHNGLATARHRDTVGNSRRFVQRGWMLPRHERAHRASVIGWKEFVDGVMRRQERQRRHH